MVLDTAAAPTKLTWLPAKRPAAKHALKVQTALLLHGTTATTSTPAATAPPRGTLATSTRPLTKWHGQVVWWGAILGGVTDD